MEKQPFINVGTPGGAIYINVGEISRIEQVGRIAYIYLKNDREYSVKMPAEELIWNMGARVCTITPSPPIPYEGGASGEYQGSLPSLDTPF